MNSKDPALPKKVHVIGICGVATSALAIAFHQAGVKVTGSDKGFFPPVSTELEKHGIDFYAGWHPEKMITNGHPDIVIVGTASGSHNPETTYAEANNIPRYSFAEAIGKHFARENSIVCCGTWGKTSSSALLSHILNESGFNPTYMFGGISLSHTSSARLTNSPWSVFEGDEYKSSPTDPTAKFFYYHPTHLLLTAVSWDHADLYPTKESYIEAFRKLVESIPKNGLIVACADENNVTKLLKDQTKRIILYGRQGPPKQTGIAYTYSNVRSTRNGLDLTISHAGQKHEIHSPMLGIFQSENITGCFAMASELGVAPENIKKAISTFQGLKRRMEKRADHVGADIIDDIAHSPEKASAVLHTLRSIYAGNIVAVFEPNSGGRRHEALSKYDQAFRDADMVIIPRLTKLKTSEDDPESPMEGQELADVIRKTQNNTHYIDDDIKLVEFLAAHAEKDGVIAFLGSHGFRGMIEETITCLRRQFQS